MSKTQPITDRIQTFADVLAEKGTTMEAFQQEHGTKSPDSFAYEQIKLIAEVYNEGNPPVYGQTGYYPYFEKIEDAEAPGGFRLSYLDYSCVDDFATVGARLQYNNPTLAKDAGRKFIDIYTNLLK